MMRKVEVFNSHRLLDSFKKKIYEDLEDKIKDLKEKYDLNNEELLKITCKLEKCVKAKNYEAHYPVPEFLLKKRLKHPNACFIQILGASLVF